MPIASNDPDEQAGLSHEPARSLLSLNADQPETGLSDGVTHFTETQGQSIIIDTLYGCRQQVYQRTHLY